VRLRNRCCLGIVVVAPQGPLVEGRAAVARSSRVWAFASIPEGSAISKKTARMVGRLIKKLRPGIVLVDCHRTEI